MDYNVYFPRGIATGIAFCNRENERQRLIKNINSRQHTLIMSPRRYGKTSLALKNLEKIKWPYAQVNLYNDTMFFIDINLY